MQTSQRWAIARYMKTTPCIHSWALSCLSEESSSLVCGIGHLKSQSHRKHVQLHRACFFVDAVAREKNFLSSAQTENHRPMCLLSLVHRQDSHTTSPIRDSEIYSQVAFSDVPTGGATPPMMISQCIKMCRCAI